MSNISFVSFIFVTYLAFLEMINLNSAFEDELYFSFLKDPDSVSNEWREYFQKIHGKSIYVIDDGNKPIPLSSRDTIDKKSMEWNPRNSNFKKNGGINKSEGELTPLNEIEQSNAYQMYESLEVPTASSTRTIPVKALDENRRIINRYLIKLKRDRVSFTHFLGWATIKALMKFPNLNDTFEVVDGIPYRVKRKAINVGLAIDVISKDGVRLLVIPNIKNVQDMKFDDYVEEFNNLIERARANKLEYNDFVDTTFTLTNPGMIGTTSSHPRLFKGQGIIVSTGSIDYPTELQAVRPEVLTTLAVSKVVNITNTYDHRIIQGAESAEFLAQINKLFLGEEQFYDQIFYSLRIPFEPIKWAKDSSNGKFSFFNVENEVEKGAHVIQMLNAYRVRGHLLASVNPLGLQTYYYPELDPAYYGFTIWDLDRVFHADDNWDENNIPLRDIIEILRETYCGSTGIEFMHIQSPEKKDWIKRRLETTRNTIEYSHEEKIGIMRKLIDAEVFENYLHTKFVGSKRFSLEGGESVVVMLDKIFESAAEAELNTIVLGMAHRGRLNVLVNNIGKKYNKIFNEFEGVIDPKSYQGSGDVKYHLGARGIYKTENNKSIKLILSPNPSHLELVDPVIEGMARALENEIGDKSYSKVLPVLVHGDAAFAGQGIVAETLNMSELDGYKTGGTIHVIINNQIGFTTTIDSARSSIYATDIAKMIQTPIIHVNGNDPEAVSSAAKFAFEYRNKFRNDVIIDILCYRKYGHNEADEPSYTQPLLYKKIKSMMNAAKLYEQQLIHENVITREEINEYYDQLKEKLDSAYANRKDIALSSSLQLLDKNGTIFDDFDSKVSEEVINEVANALSHVPEGFRVNPKLATLLQKRADMVKSDKPQIDWAMAELLAFGTLLIEGKEVRFSGQDSRRGTFSQRHAVMTDMITEIDYISLNHIRKQQSVLRIFDSPLSEVAVLGFEYGYSIISEDGLTLWEAQFGDFANNAQTIVDQYLACGEVKWGQTSNLVMLLPHGYDGQGSEHSSARLERYLQLCAENNLIVGNFTTPSNYFHALRRQTLMPYKMPMILMTPKGMLRHPLKVSSVEDLSKGKFIHIIDDNSIEKNQVRKVLLCTGKVYFDIETERRKRNINDIAIVRIEQLYPFHQDLFDEIINSYKNAKNICWVQEEPKNMGAWNYLHQIFIESDSLSSTKVNYIGRKASAATATGIHQIHLAEQYEIVDSALS